MAANSDTGILFWLKVLDDKQFDDNVVLDCLLKLNEIKILHRQLQEDVTVILQSMVSNASASCITSPYLKDLMINLSAKVDPDLLFLMFVKLFTDVRGEFSLACLISIMEKQFHQHVFQQLLVQESCKSQLPRTLQNKLIHLIAAFPEHIANKEKSVERSSIFYYENFFVFLGIEVAESLICLKTKLTNGHSIQTEFLGLCIGQFCFTGKSDLFFKALLPFLIYRTNQDFALQRILHQMFVNIPDRCMESVLSFLFRNTPQMHCLYTIVGNLIEKSQKGMFVLQHKFLLMKFFKDSAIAENIFSYLNTLDSGEQVIVETLQKMLVAWCSTSSIKRTSYEQHKYLSMAILVCIRYLSHLNQQQKDGMLQSLMEGMQNHLSSPDERIRTLGMLVGEALTDSLHLPVKEEAKLKFDYIQTEETTRLLQLSTPLEKPTKSFYAEQNSKYCKIREQFNSSRALNNESAYTTPKSTFMQVAALQNIRLLIDDHESSSQQTEEKDEQTDSDDDDLKPYPMPDERPFSKISAPLYIRDCMEGLVSSDSREKTDIYLGSLLRLIQSDPVASREVAVELSKILLNMQNQYALDGFGQIRRNALAALAALNPEKVAEYLTGEFYSEHYNLQQRIDMLDVMVMAAGRLSAFDSTDKPKQIEEISGPSSDTNPQVSQSKEQQLPWQQVVADRIEAKTRRFGKPRQPAPETRPVRFGPVSGCFFYPLMAGYDRRIKTLDLLGTDSIVLGRLLYTLGTILYSSIGATNAEAMCSSLLDFVTSLRHHAEPFVRRACVYCVSMVTATTPRLTDGLADAALEAREWLCDVIGNDDDTQTRSIAANTLTMMDVKARGELRLANSVT